MSSLISWFPASIPRQSQLMRSERRPEGRRFVFGQWVFAPMSLREIWVALQSALEIDPPRESDCAAVRAISAMQLDDQCVCCLFDCGRRSAAPHLNEKASIILNGSVHGVMGAPGSPWLTWRRKQGEKGPALTGARGASRVASLVRAFWHILKAQVGLVFRRD